MRQVLLTTATIRGFGCALALTISAMALSGCVSAAKETAATEQTVPEIAAADAEQAVPAAYQDQQVAAVGANTQQQAADPVEANAMVPAVTDGQPASLTMQSTGVKATSSSIFAVQTPNAVPVPAQNADAGTGNAPLPVGQQTGVNPTTNSLFNSGQPAANPAALPLEGATNTEGAVPATQQVASAEVGTAIPVAVPIPSSGNAMRDGGSVPQPAATQTASADPTAVAVAAVPESGNAENDGDEQDATQKPLTFAALFAAKRKSRNQFDGDRFAKAPAKKTLVAANMPQQQIAALGFTDLPGVQTTSMFATVDDAQPGHDDDSAAVEVAALPGLARLAPNGLWLQTENVETGCFRPELLQVLKVVETHYGRKIMVTSGLRDVKHNIRAGGRRYSLHTTCQAADIQVPGVSKWDLANYLRTIPGRGGVGTYCHTESVHIDTGEARDWNWRCRRRKT
ncbi:D-Ala-D-Ala carboxypeptidase family metallohydrolase [Pararhizobium sp. A13]|uniref:D-Ala-D-Ala carboxypeptidase family metallohydrolase n=1 Tax=Pararhizobium sp. A13 TaxID=3133975 RepID=UPI003248FF01